jgi:hypothetical protein
MKKKETCGRKEERRRIEKIIAPVGVFLEGSMRTLKSGLYVS